MKRILVVHPHLRPGGGSEARPLWIAEALKREYEVTLISQGRIDLAELNKAYGTSLQDKEIGKIELPSPSFVLNRFDAYRSIPLIRFCQNHAHDFDVLISAYNILDFKKRGIQFIADFSFSDRLRRKFHPSSSWQEKLVYEFSPWRFFYLKLAQWLSRTSSSGWRSNLTIANSRWTQKILKEYFNLDSEVIYPPVMSSENTLSWESREDGFIVLGRVSPEKRIEAAIDIVQAVRERLKGKSVHLHLIGGASRTSYLKKIKLKITDCQEWIFWEGPAYGSVKFELLGRHKFGLHGLAFESFGIAVAEMIKSGCLVWVPAGGGQEEIVNHYWLVYNNLEDAVEKITYVLRHPELQKELLFHLKKQSENFSAKTFQEKVRDLIFRFVNDG
jgi:glycosyltransferase involved in cell wall biosynthesis